LVLLELAHRNHAQLPASTEQELREWLRFRDFDQFNEAMLALRPLIASAEDLELIVYEFGRELGRQNVRYAEVMITPRGYEIRGIEHPAYMEALDRGRKRARADFGLELRWIFDIQRSLADRKEIPYWADYTTEAAIAGSDLGVVALGLSGLETGFPPEDFAPWFERARAAGLHSVPHAGELAGPESVWGAIRALGAERVAHGVRAIEDPGLVEYLARHQIPLDVCPTSNVLLGVFPSRAAHPLRRLHESGVPITVNSDDPTMFWTTLTEEAAALTIEHGLDNGAAAEIVANGFRFAFDAAEVA
jgi:aminodeoxyfutalosine deaminase